jgi:hypothetical protein
LKAIYLFGDVSDIFDMAQVDTFGIILRITLGETFP